MNAIPNLPFARLMPFSEVEEKRPVLLVTSMPAWNAVSASLGGLHTIALLEATQANTAHWDDLLSKIGERHPEVVYAVGGGLTADAAKYLASRLNLGLVVLPTALSVDAFLTAASGIRREGCVYYIPTKAPESLILDLEVIAGAPPSIRAAGVTDVMSIATGCWARSMPRLLSVAVMWDARNWATIRSQASQGSTRSPQVNTSTAAYPSSGQVCTARWDSEITTTPETPCGLNL